MNILLLVLGWIAFPAGVICEIVSTAIKKEHGACGDATSSAALKKKLKNKSILAVVIGLLLIILGSSFTIIPTGKVGVVYDFGVLNENKGVLGTGVQWHKPFVQEIRQYSVMQENSNEAMEAEARIWGESKDKLPIYCRDVRITYQINSEGLIYLLENVADISELSTWGKTTASAFAAATIQLDDIDVAKQSLVEPIMLHEMQRLTDAKYGFSGDNISNVTVVRVLIGELDYEQGYQDAITAKKNAEQLAIEQEVVNKKNEAQKISEAEQARIEASGKANAKIENARGEAESIRLTAEAQAEANVLLTESLSEVILANNWILKWDGKMPVVTDGGGNIIDISGFSARVWPYAQGRQF